MPKDEQLARYAYLTALLSDMRFKASVGQFFEQLKKEHLLKVSALTSSQDQIRFSQGVLEAVRLYENLFLNAKRQLESKEK